MKLNKKIIDKVSMALVAVGGLNWGAVALGYNFVDSLFAGFNTIIYGLVGIATIWLLVKSFR